MSFILLYLFLKKKKKYLVVFTVIYYELEFHLSDIYYKYCVSCLYLLSESLRVNKK